MNLNSILQKLKEQRSKLDSAIAALESTDGVRAYTGKRRGRPPGSKKQAATKRAMSAAARKRIAEAMRLRWEAATRSGKNRL